MDTIYPMAFYAAMNRVFRIADVRGRPAASPPISRCPLGSRRSSPGEFGQHAKTALTPVQRQLSKIELKRAPLARARIEEARKKSKALLVQYGVAKL
jgi:hypothetical protein